MSQLKLGLVAANPELLKEARTAIQGLPVRLLIEQESVGDMAGFLDQLEQARLDVLVLDVTRLSEPYDSVIRRVKACAAAPQVIALSDAAEPEVILGAIRAGANEFLYPPIEAGLHKALERLAVERKKTRAAAPASHVGRTVGFLSSKGGCGATTIACHMAVEIQKATLQEVLLADLDMDAGLISFLMKSKSAYTVLDAVRNVNRLDESYWRALVSNGYPGVEVISAPPAGTQREHLEGEPFRNVLRFARTSYDWVVADLGRSLNRLTAGLIEEIDETYLIATLDLPALQQTKQVVQAILDLGYSRNRLRLILNRAPKRTDFDLAQVQKILGLPIYEMLPNSYPELFEATSEGKLLTGGAELGKSFGSLAAKIAGVQPSPAKDKGKGRLNLSFF